MKNLLNAKVLVLVSTVLMIVCGYIKAVSSMTGMDNPFVMMLVVFWGPVLAMFLIYVVYCMLYGRR